LPNLIKKTGLLIFYHKHTYKPYRFRLNHKIWVYHHKLLIQPLLSKLFSIITFWNFCLLKALLSSNQPSSLIMAFYFALFPRLSKKQTSTHLLSCLTRIIFRNMSRPVSSRISCRIAFFCCSARLNESAGIPQLTVAKRSSEVDLFIRDSYDWNSKFLFRVVHELIRKRKKYIFPKLNPDCFLNTY